MWHLPLCLLPHSFFYPKVDSWLGVNWTGWAKLGCTVVPTQTDKTCEYFPSPQGLIWVNGMQRLLMMYYEASCPEGTDSNLAYTYEVSPRKMLLQIEGWAVNYVKWVGGLSQDLSWPESNSQKPPIEFIPLLAVYSREWINAKWLSGQLLLWCCLWG